MAANRDRLPLSPASLAKLRALYRGGVEYLDLERGQPGLARGAECSQVVGDPQAGGVVVG